MLTQVESSTLPKEPSDTSMEQSTLAITNYAYGDHQEETKSSVRSALPEVTSTFLLVYIGFTLLVSTVIRVLTIGRTFSLEASHLPLRKFMLNIMAWDMACNIINILWYFIWHN